MAGLAGGEASPLAWGVLQKGAPFFMTIDDEVVLTCMKMLARPPYGDTPIVAGESAVAGFAALLCISGDSGAREAFHLTRESRVLLFGTEGDTDPSIYEDVVGCPGDEIRKQ